MLRNEYDGRGRTKNDVDGRHPKAGQQTGQQSPRCPAVLVQHCPVSHRNPCEVDNEAAYVGDDQGIVVAVRGFDVGAHVDAQKEHDDEELQHIPNQHAS